jgi:hypothetical protein
MLLFRFLHIVAGALWVGSAFLFSAFLGPSAAQVGPSAGPPADHPGEPAQTSDGDQDALGDHRPGRVDHVVAEHGHLWRLR